MLQVRFCTRLSHCLGFGLLTAAMVTLFSTATSAFAQTEFSWSPVSPMIGETVVFTISDEMAVPLSWDFGDDGCGGQAATIDCTWTPDYCRNIPFTYSSAGPKTVRLLTDQGETSQTLEVANEGECCGKDGRPHAAFLMKPNPVFTGQQVYFSDASSQKNGTRKALGLEWSPADPEIGEVVVFSITGIDSVERVDWSFGEAGCGTLEPEQICEPLFFDCLSTTFTYASGGEKTVELVIDDGAQTLTATVTVANEGACDGGGCSFQVTPDTRSFDAAGGTDSFVMNAGPDCPWTAVETASWLTIVSGASGTGNGSAASS